MKKVIYGYIYSHCKVNEVLRYHLDWKTLQFKTNLTVYSNKKDAMEYPKTEVKKIKITIEDIT